MSTAEEEIESEAEAVQAELKMRAELSIRPRRHVITSAARQQAEKDRREKLLRQIKAEFHMPLTGCRPCSPKVKQKIRDNVIRGGLIPRLVDQ